MPTRSFYGDSSGGGTSARPVSFDDLANMSDDSDAPLPMDGAPRTLRERRPGTPRHASPPVALADGNPDPRTISLAGCEGGGSFVSLLLGPGAAADAQDARARPYIHPAGLRGWSDTLLDYVAPTSEAIASYVAAAAAKDQAKQGSSPVKRTPEQPPLTADELELARPHPDAFYCPRQCCWRVVTPWPPHSARSSVCPEPSARPSDAPLAHYWVRVPRVVDPRFVLRVPSEGVEQRMATDEPHADPADELGLPTFAPALPPGEAAVGQATDPEHWWDLLVCARCRLAVTASGGEDGACASLISRSLLDRLQADLEEPIFAAAGRKDTLGRRLRMWSTINFLVGNLLLRGSRRSVRNGTLSKRLPWSKTVQELVTTVLHFDILPDTDPAFPDGLTITPPHKGEVHGPPEVMAYRARLARLWIESGLHIGQLELSTGTPSTDPRVKLETLSVRPRLIDIFGGQDCA